MSNSTVRPAPPDQSQRNRALDPARTSLVQAPAGSGKTDLLTRRFLRLLAEVDSPSQIVAITFTRVAAAEMRHRILAELEKAVEMEPPSPESDPFSMDSLARRALARSRALNWNLTDLPAQLRISTIDSFCRELALQRPLVSGLGGSLDTTEQSGDLYRRAARRTLQQIDGPDHRLSDAIATLLAWRDNNWQEIESLLVEMLASRDRWMQGFLLESDPDWDALRARLERPFANAARASLIQLSQLLDQVPHARQEALELARFACTESAGALHRELAELADFPIPPFADAEALEEARQACECLAALLLTKDGALRRRIDKNVGFPADRKKEKARLLQLIADLEAVPGLESALASVRELPPARYTDDDWQIVRACFTLLRRAAAELKVVFAEAGSVDFTEVSQAALAVLRSEDNFPSEAALAAADGIHHLLVDELQDTSRRQHQLLAHLIAAWPQREGRTCFVVGDPMQSIYFFRDADAELFARIRDYGLELPADDPLLFNHVLLTANFRATPPLVARLNGLFQQIFAEDDGSGIAFSIAEPARQAHPNTAPKMEGTGTKGTGAKGTGVKGTGFSPYINATELARALAPQGQPSANPEPFQGSIPKLILHFNLHLNFVPQSAQKTSDNSEDGDEKEEARAAQTEEIISLIRAHLGALESARSRGEKYRIAVLARTKNALAPIAQALREAQIPFRALDLEKLRDRPEVLDALALARALLNPYDRVSWLGVLRAPWCGLSLADLHTLTSADEPSLLARPVPDLLAERLDSLSEDGRQSAARVLAALAAVPALRAAKPTASLGVWLEHVWLRLGGDACADAAARVNLNLLWSCLDRLPNGEQDLLGPALDSALEKLTAQQTGAPYDGVSSLGWEPDPAASSDYGVQLMTIHKSKGLEFEIVIVPELQARTRNTGSKMLTWLERGLAEPDESGEIVEFLIAPFQPKGAERSSTKAWVDGVYRGREQQETRRILYVASTRAREELHFFARPAYKIEKDGSFVLAEPPNSLLKTAWPALQEEVRERFEQWKAAAGKPPAQIDSTEIESIAASAAGNLLLMPSPVKPNLLRRLPSDYKPAQMGPAAPDDSRDPISAIGATVFYARHEGGQLSRALGSAVHALLEELARLRAAGSWPSARAALRLLEPRIAAEVRGLGVTPDQAASVAAQALKLALAASSDPICAWILSPHPQAASEAHWAGVVDGSLRTVRVDRVFQAGPLPGSKDSGPDGELCWWIVDYKTAHADSLDPAVALPELRELFAPQLEAYARVLRNLHGADSPIHAGLYYPRMAQFDWWEPL